MILRARGVSDGYYHTRLVLSASASERVDCVRLATAWKEIVAKHSILRTVLLEKDSGYDQAVLEFHEPQVELADSTFAGHPMQYPRVI